MTQTTVALLQIAGTVVAVFLGLLALTQWQIGPMRRSLESTSQKVDLLIVAVGEALPYLSTKKVAGAAQGLDQFRKALLRLLVPVVAFEQAAGNPLTRDELHRLMQYNATLEDRMLTPEEAADFQALVNKIEADHPKKPGVGALVATAAILAGLAVLIAGARGGNE